MTRIRYSIQNRMKRVSTPILDDLFWNILNNFEVRRFAIFFLALKFLSKGVLATTTYRPLDLNRMKPVPASGKTFPAPVRRCRPTKNYVA